MTRALQGCVSLVTVRGVAVALVVLATLGATAGHAAVLVGPPLPAVADGAPVPCTTASGAGCVALHTDAGTISDGYVVPIDGIVTSWRVVEGGPGDVRLYRLRPDGSGGDAANQQLVWSGPAGPGDRVGLVEESARSPVQAGDELGVSFSGTLTAVGADPAAEILLGSGPSPFDGDLDVAGGRLLLQATVEPDADRDGYGDDTQDHCPGPKSIPCASMGFAVDPAPAAMPGGSVTQALRVRNSGPGYTHPTTAVELKATRGASATVDGAPCTNPDPTSPHWVRCPVGRMPAGQVATIVLTSPGLRPGPNRVSVAVEPSNRTGLRIADIFQGSNQTAFTITTPTLPSLRPSAVIGARVRSGRMHVVVSCPAAGTQDCRVRVDASLARKGKRVVGLRRGVATVRRGTTRTVRLPLSRTARSVLRRGGVQARVTLTRTDVASGPLRVPVRRAITS